ncbi:putative jacalin-like lectin domain-containing protein [Helianthus debilis subsp. tardiflorus]
MGGDEWDDGVHTGCPVVYGGSPVIRSLTFKSNKRTFGPFGVEEGIPFNFFTNEGHIEGFNGRSRWFLDSLVFYLSSYSSPKTKPLPKI